jgi:beta-RFAP synthase
LQVLVERCPREHTGLGVGTQLALAVGKAIAVATGRHPTAVELATAIGRGHRSAVGTHGFDRGGLLIDAGKCAGEPVAPILAQIHLPEAWRVVLFTPPVADSWSGDREAAAFTHPSPGQSVALRDLAETILVPAARKGDLVTFGGAVYEFNRRAGEPFAAVQGGTYSSPAISELITDLRRLGVHAVGQSSWGPTVFAVTPDPDAANWLAGRFVGRLPVTVTRISAGHRVESY